MDDRQTQIREGAGLEDSRVNQEFIDFLNKWSSPVLLALAVAMAAWWGLQYLEKKKIARIDQAFSELAAATQGGNPSPASLKTIADEYQGIRSVSEMALLTTADLYLNAFVVGIEPGAETDPLTGLPMNEDDMLDENRRQVYLEQAGQVANQVLEISQGVEGKELIAMQAMTRLAAIKEGGRDFEAAQSMYEQLEALAASAGYPSVVNFAVARVNNLAQLKDVAPLPHTESLVPLPGEASVLPAPQQPTLTQEQIQEILDSIQSNEAAADPAAEPAIADEVADEPAPETGDEPASP